MKVLFSLKSLLYPLAFILSFLPFSSVCAGTPNGLLIHAPVPAAIPSLSGTMLIVLCVLLLAISFRVAKQKNSGAKHFIIAVLGVGALISATGGVKLISDANALTTHSMAATGGSLPVVILDLNTYNNMSAVAQTITSIALPVPSSACPDTDPPGPGLTRCKVGDVIPPGGSCSINCTITPGPA